MAQEGREITGSLTLDNLKKGLEEMMCIRKPKRSLEMYWLCNSNGYIESLDYCSSEDCLMCSKYRKALKEAKIYERG